MKYYLSIFFLVFVWSAFADETSPIFHTPSQQEYLSADYGSYPNNYVDIITSYLQDLLKEPDYARYKYIQPPTKGWNGKVGFGYFACAYVNSKNSIDGYSGDRLVYFMIKNGEVTDSTYEEKNIDEYSADILCTEERYRAPEGTIPQGSLAMFYRNIKPKSLAAL